MEKILSREELMELQGIGNGTYSGLSDDEAKSIISTALALMDERDKMKAGVEKLREKYNKRYKELNKIYEGAFDRSALTMIIQDLSSIGKEEK